jgi:fluoride exporter
MWKELALLAVAGAIGTLSRYGLSGLVQWFCGERFPWGTVAVNLTGCFLFGLIWTLAEERLIISGQTRFILLTGFMGAFTTFSTLAFETSGFLQDSMWWPAAGNAFGQLFAGVALIFLGFAIGRLF